MYEVLDFFSTGFMAGWFPCQTILACMLGVDWFHFFDSKA